MTTESSDDSQMPARLTYEKINEDLRSIPINETDVLFGEFAEASDSEDEIQAGTGPDKVYERLEKFILFKSNLELENQQLKSDFSLNGLSSEFELLESRVGSLQHFIDISKKFFSISNK